MIGRFLETFFVKLKRGSIGLELVVEVGGLLVLDCQLVFFYFNQRYMQYVNVCVFQFLLNEVSIFQYILKDRILGESVERLQVFDDNFIFVSIVVRFVLMVWVFEIRIAYFFLQRAMLVFRFRIICFISLVFCWLFLALFFSFCSLLRRGFIRFNMFVQLS